MDEDILFTENDTMPYEDDVPYEAQLSNSTEHTDAASLKKRIGNRIYLLEDSMSKKRKLMDAEDNADEYGAEVNGGNADTLCRPNALLLQGPPITQLPTARVFAYATHFDAHPIGLEWVDDQTCVLVFANRKNALQAWGALRRTTQPETLENPTAIEAEDSDEAFCPAHSLPLALYPMEDRINAVLGNKKSHALKQVIRIRWARSTDVKERGARVRSEFYKRHGEMAGKEGLPGFSNLGTQDEAVHRNKRRKRNDEEETRRQLDVELDVFLVEDEATTSDHVESRVTGGQSHEVPRREGRSQFEEEERRKLDYELDTFLAGGDDADQSLDPAEASVKARARPDTSLLQRTKQELPRDRSRRINPLPRRGMRNGQGGTTSGYNTDMDGRWLHNAERTSTRRNDSFDEEGFGMRAWGRARNRRLRPRKTQEELDQELDEIWHPTNPLQ